MALFAICFFKKVIKKREREREPLFSGINMASWTSNLAELLHHKIKRKGLMYKIMREKKPSFPNSSWKKPKLFTSQPQLRNRVEDLKNSNHPSQPPCLRPAPGMAFSMRRRLIFTVSTCKNGSMPTQTRKRDPKKNGNPLWLVDFRSFMMFFFREFEES